MQELFSSLDFSKLANAILGLLTAGVVWLALKIGRHTTTPPGKVTETTMDGITVISSEPLMALAGSIEALSMQATLLGKQLDSARGDGERLRSVAHQIVEAGKDTANEVKELRAEVRRLVDAKIARR